MSRRKHKAQSVMTEQPRGLPLYRDPLFCRTLVHDACRCVARCELHMPGKGGSHLGVHVCIHGWLS